MKCSTDFKFFCERLLGMTELGGIHEFQLEWIDIIEKNELVVIEAPSGFSKSQIVGACYPVWCMFRDKGLEILLISKTRDQGAKILLDRIKDLLSENEFIREMLVPNDRDVTWNQTEVYTKKNHKCRSVPYNVNVKGYRSHLTICDEADSYDETETFFKHVLSRSHPGGKTVLITTPEGSTRLVQQIKDMNKLNPKYKIFKTTAIIKADGSYLTANEVNTYDDLVEWGKKGATCIWPEKFTYEQLIDKWFDGEKWSWMQNYLCEIIGETEDALFPLKTIINSYHYDKSFDYECDNEAMYFIGADFAISDGPKADFDAYVVIKLKDDMYTLVSAETHKGWQRPQKEERLKELYKRYSSRRGCRIVADESHIGTIFMNDLRSHGVTVIAQNFNPMARKAMLMASSNIFQGKSIIIPKNATKRDQIEYMNELQNQLTGFTRGKTDKGNETVFSKYRHDDLAMAFCMALVEASKQMTTTVRPRIIK
jgi:hypothetical protein